MDQLIELFDQIIEMAKAGRDALKGAAADSGSGGGAPAPEGGTGGEPAPAPEGGGEPPKDDKQY